MMHSVSFADEARSVYTSSEEFAYDHVSHDKVVPITKDTDTRINIKVMAQRRSVKGILLLFFSNSLIIHRAYRGAGQVRL